MKYANDHRPILRARAAALFMALLLAAAMSAGTASAGCGVGVAAPPVATTLDAGAAKEYWTPERISGAQPLDLAEGDVDAEAATAPPEVDLFGAPATPFGSDEINKPEKYPNRVHGKLFGTYRRNR